MLINQVTSVRDTSFTPGNAAPAATAATTRAAPPVGTEPSPVSEAQLKEAVAAANESVAMHSNNSIEFSIDAQRGTTIVKVVDKNTGQIIRQMPSREMIELAKALDQSKVMLIRRTV